MSGPPCCTVSGERGRQNLGLQLTVTAGTLEQAIPHALDVAGTAVRDAYGSCAVAVVEVMSETEFDRRQALPTPVPELGGRQTVIGILNVAPARADQIMKSKQWADHVEPITTIDGKPVFAVADVQHFADHVRTPGQAGRPKRSATTTEQTA